MKNKDIFISYKNDGEGNNFAARLFEDLNRLGYNVYFNSHEKKIGSFPDRLRAAIAECKDFLLIISNGCLMQLKENREIDWIREEILCAKEHKKNIIPILIGSAEMPQNKKEMPLELSFLPDLEACVLPEQYILSPFETLLNMIDSMPESSNAYKHDFNNNPNYSVEDDFKELLKKAQSGDIYAMYRVACYYSDGIVGAVSYSDAAYWLEKLVECDDEEIRSHANAMIAGYYYRGAMPGRAQSYEKAYIYRTKAEKDQGAIMQLAAMKRIGSGCDFDYTSIEKSFQNVENGDSINRHELAMFYITYGKFDKAIEIYENMEEVMPEAEYQLGMLYKLGVHNEPPKPDYISAGYHLQNAADAGHMQAAYEFGMINFNPTGRYKKDFNKAEKYFKIAADAGIAEAQYKLGWIYQNGLNGEKNIEESIKYNEKAAEQGHVGAAGSLALLYQEPDYVDYQKACKYAKQSADAGYATGAYRYANFLLLGRGCKADEEKAYRYYSIAHEHGVENAKYMMEKIKLGKNNV